MMRAVAAPVAPFRPRVARGALAWPSIGRGVLVLAVAGGLAAGLLASDGVLSAQAVALSGPDLTRLLRAMAAIKAVMALAALGVVWWRLGVPVGAIRLAGYATSCAAMAAGPGLIWQMVHVGWGAALLHGGLLAAVLLLWRDPATSGRLAVLVAARRGVGRLPG
jgi:hypothetical protein